MDLVQYKGNMSLSRCLLLPRLAVVKSAGPSGRGLQTSSVVNSAHELEYWWGPEKGAGREYVGYGIKGDYNYEDRYDYWYPGIRFRKDDDIVKPIREKEKSDWKKLSMEEKKLLYRYSFRQTLTELRAPTGYWKVCAGIVLSCVGIALFYASFMNHFVLPPLPETNSNIWKETQAEKLLITRRGHPNMPGELYDYENHRWKK